MTEVHSNCVQTNTPVYGYIREAVRVKVKKCDGGLPPEFRKFSIDPQITSFEVLQSIIAKAFDIKSIFTVCYRALDDYGQEAYLPLLSDWDLEAAILSASDPCLTLQVDVRSAEEQPEGWLCPEPAAELTLTQRHQLARGPLSEPKAQTKLPGLIMNRMEKTLNIFQRAFNLGEDQGQGPALPARPPLADAEFRSYLNAIGQIVHFKELRSAIYFGGVDPSLRKVVWKHILNVYPEGMSGKERMDYIKTKTHEYEGLRSVWRDMVQQGAQAPEGLAYVTSMVRKDVLRTDRHHKFYAGSDDNQNIASLFNILTTYSLNHPTVSYCQGMSDLASPLLVTMGDEAHAYICFCALMRRLKPNFMLDGVTMTLKFQHLTEGLIFYDPEFHAYLKLHQAEDLLFCYRWLLLEMKREFAFEDALHMLEVLWSSLQLEPPETDLPLYETKFCSQSPPPPISPLLKTPRENPYTKVCALRRQSSSVSLNATGSGRRIRTISHRQNQSLDETILARQNRLRKQGHVKPFASLDDNSVSADGKKRVKNGALSSSTGNLIEVTNKRNLSKRLAEENHSPSLAQLDKYSQKENEDSKINKVHKGRVVKNLNEFLDFARGTGHKAPVITVTSVVRSPVDEVGGDVAQSDVDSSPSLSCTSSASPNVFEESSPEDSTDHYPMATSMTRELRLELDNLDRKVFGKPKSTEPEVFIWENPLKCPATPDEQSDIDLDSVVKTETPEAPQNGFPCEEATEMTGFLTRSAQNLKAAGILNTLRSGGQLLRANARPQASLPPPAEFGGGNPFLMFLSLTLLRQHRDHIMRSGMDYNEMAMHFDKMVRKHNVARVLDEARAMFSSYLKQHSMQTASPSKHNVSV